MSNPIVDLVKGIGRWYGITRRDQQTLQDRLKEADVKNQRLNEENQKLFEEIERLRKENAALKACPP